MTKSALQLKMEKLLAEARAKKAAAQAANNLTTVSTTATIVQTPVAEAVNEIITEVSTDPNLSQGTDRFGKTITYNIMTTNELIPAIS
jgi:hypothetical protein